MLNEQRFQDEHGRLKQWPSKQADKILALAYLATKFDFERSYKESDVNEILKKWHTFNDWPLIRRELYEHGFLQRNTDGSNYQLKRVKTSMPELLLTFPNLETDPQASVLWLTGSAGRETLRLMGNPPDSILSPTVEAEKQRIRQFFISTDQLTWALRYKGTSIGAIWVNLKSTSYLFAPSLHIMIGDPRARGKGIGEAAMLSVIDLLKANGKYQEIHSRYIEGNIGSAKLLAKVGFANNGSMYEDDNGLMYEDDNGLSFQNVSQKL